MLNKDSSFMHGFKFFKFQTHVSISERDRCRIQITPQHNSLNTKITPKLATAVRYLIYKHSTFLPHKVTRALPNATVLQWS